MAQVAAPHTVFDAAHPLWNDWRAQLRQRVTTVDALLETLPHLAPRREELAKVHQRYPLSITPYYLSLAQPENPDCPILAQAVGRREELTAASGQATHDPLDEEHHRPGRVFLHRYPDRLLVFTGSHCGVICRHCTRKRLIGLEPLGLGARELAEVVAYLHRHTEIREVILSGGDPLMLSDKRLLEVLKSIFAVPHVDLIRLGTRVPVTLPMRVTRALARALSATGPVWCVTHFNHPAELTPQSSRALENLVLGGVPVLNQSVLLKGVNDDFDVLLALNRGLVKRRVKPYYLHHGDHQAGALHFQTGIEAGLALMAQWPGHSGLLMPHFCVDGLLGKVPMFPQLAEATEEGWWVAENFEGRSGFL